MLDLLTKPVPSNDALLRHKGLSCTTYTANNQILLDLSRAAQDSNSYSCCYRRSAFRAAGPKL